MNTVEDHTIQSEIKNVKSAWHVTKLICIGVVVVSLLLCVVIAILRSEGLSQVTVTALEADAEPRDHGIPLIKQKDALPDYELRINLSSGESVKLGARPNTSAVKGLTWTLNEPVSVSDIVSVRLQEQDKLVSDVVAEVELTRDSVSVDNYRFDFTTAHSLSVGVQSFFRTPIGLAIAGAFFVAILITLAPNLGL